MKKKALLIRHGAWGDAIQAACTFPYFRDDGYEITFYGNDRAWEVLQGHPDIAEWKTFVDDQIPIPELESHYEEIGAAYDKTVVFTGTIENELLFGLGQNEYELSHEERRLIANNRNYYDAHVIRAGYEPDKPNTRLHFNRVERKQGERFRRSYKKRDRIIIVWALSGSAIHKQYRYFEQVVRAFCQKHQNVRFITVGDYPSRLVTFDHPQVDNSLIEKQVPFRQTLLTCKYADIVIGPETGTLMGAGAFDDVSKIVLMSHSGPDQIIKHWENAEALVPPCNCSPCHLLFKYTDIYKEKCDLYTIEFDKADAAKLGVDSFQFPCCTAHDPVQALDALERAYEYQHKNQTMRDMRVFGG